MSKIICDVCGTSYPEASAQCPICGCVRPADAPVVKSEPKESAALPYQHVKGGRFSKANVKKRNASSQQQTRAHTGYSTSGTTAAKNTKKRKSSNVGLVVTIFVLLVAILAVIGYIVVKLWGGSSTADVQAPDQYAVETVDATVTEPEVPCEDIILDTDEYNLTEIGQKTALRIALSPENTTDALIYVSDNEEILAVDNKGILTAVGYGEATVTVQCGSMSAQCHVTVMPPFELDTTAIVLDTVGQEQSIYSGVIAVEEIIWTTDDSAVATIENGIVTAVAAGATTVYGEYNGTSLSCTVECSIVEETVPEETTAETEETQAPTVAETYKEPFMLKNLMGGRNDDVSLTAGETFRLALVDANGDTISGVTWSVKNGNACTVSDGTVKAVALGYAEVVATYNGETYVCIVRVR